MIDKLFKFYSNPLSLHGSSIIVYLELADKNDSNWEDFVLNKFDIELKFPYYGFNWDALHDCLRDLEWLENKKVTIIHSKIQFPIKKFKFYIRILLSSAESQLQYNQIIDIYFHEDNRLEIEAIAQQSLYE
jgi:hypothetical protein